MIACACLDAARESLFVPDNLAPQEWYLSPAVCYHAYAHYQGQVLADTQIVTARGRCYRREDSFQFGRRQLEFEMREIVLLGDLEWLNQRIAQLQTEIDRIAGAYGLPAHWETAEDPFFLPTAKGKALMQRLMETKKELVCDEPDPLALASINRHGTFCSSFARLSGLARKLLFVSPQQILPLAKFAFEAHALGDLKCRDDASLDLLSALACPFAG